MTKVALIYDFDGTLAPGNMQEFGFIEAMGYATPRDFWLTCDALAADNDANGIQIVQYRMLECMLQHGITPTREAFRKFGAKVTFFPGVQDWFARINAYGQSLGLEVEHYINSSGLTEMIEGTPIAHEFTHIYACSYLYQNGVACWPAVTVDYSGKVQFLAKISKGIREVSDSKRVNAFVPVADRAIPYERMIYFGDGETDVPSMRIVKNENGHSLAIYSNEAKRQLATQLLSDGRVNFACPADYSEGSQVDKVVKHVLDGIALRYK